VRILTEDVSSSTNLLALLCYLTRSISRPALLQRYFSFVSILAWEVADAHFNMAITIADFIQKAIQNSDDIVHNAI